MFATGPTTAIVVHVGGNRYVQLTRDIGHHHRWDGGPILRKGAEKPQRAELDRPAEAVAIAAQRCQVLAIRIVQIEILSELGRGRVAGIPAVLCRLLLGEEIDWRGNPSLRGTSRACLTWVHPPETDREGRVVAVSGVSYACLINHTEKGAVGR